MPASIDRRPPAPVRVDARAMVLAGTGLWLLAGIVLAVLLFARHADVGRWLAVCAVGFVVGALWSLRPTPHFTGVSGQDSFGPAED